MKVQRNVAVVALVIAVAGLLTLLILTLFYPSEPIYNGKSLSAWAQHYGKNNWTTNRAAAEEAQVAIRKIGTNGIPFLLDLVEARESNLKKSFRQLVPTKWHAALRLQESGIVRRIGAHGLAALGTNAPGAVPSLIELAKNHPDEDGRYIALFALNTLGPAAEPAVPFFLQCLTNKNSIIRMEAADALIRVPQQWENTLPRLFQYFEFNAKSDAEELQHTIMSMNWLGTNAKPAVPTLLFLLRHQRPNIREEVTNCLPRIDPEAASKAHIKRPQ